MHVIYMETTFCVITTCNKAAVMKPLTTDASSSCAASTSPCSLVSPPSLKVTTEEEDGEGSGIRTSEAVLLTAVCPSVWTQVRCEIRPADPKLSFSIFCMCYCMNLDTLYMWIYAFVCLQTNKRPVNSCRSFKFQKT